MTSLKKYKHKESGKIAAIKEFGTRLEKSGKMTTLVWVKKENEEKAEMIPAKDFDAEYDEITNKL